MVFVFHYFAVKYLLKWVIKEAAGVCTLLSEILWYCLLLHLKTNKQNRNIFMFFNAVIQISVQFLMYRNARPRVEVNHDETAPLIRS